MIETRSLPKAYRGVATNSQCEMHTDAPLAKGGGGTGFGAHELLEAALATCVNMAVRMTSRCRLWRPVCGYCDRMMKPLCSSRCPSLGGRSRRFARPADALDAVAVCVVRSAID